MFGPIKGNDLPEKKHKYVGAQSVCVVVLIRAKNMFPQSHYGDSPPIYEKAAGSHRLNHSILRLRLASWFRLVYVSRELM